jgi:hypothetical protein
VQLIKLKVQLEQLVVVFQLFLQFWRVIWVHTLLLAFFWSQHASLRAFQLERQLAIR